MPLDNIKKICFVHIPKTAGTSVEISMDIYSYSGPDDVNLVKRSFSSTNQSLLFGNNLQHLTFVQITQYIEKLKLDPTSYSYFTIIRNPAERLISHYKARRLAWIKKGLKNNLFELCIFLFRITLVRPFLLLPNVTSFHYIKRLIYPHYHHLISQSRFVYHPHIYLKIFDFARISEINKFLVTNGYSELKEFRVSRMKVSPIIAYILTLYSRLFYSNDHKLYAKFKKN